jgi:hypothetical protein
MCDANLLDLDGSQVGRFEKECILILGCKLEEKFEGSTNLEIQHEVVGPGIIDAFSALII